MFACTILYVVLYGVMRRTREQIRIDNRPKRVLEYISKNKYLVNSVHFKNNYWSWAAWDSWAARGQAGGCCVCHEGHYNATLHNKRAKTKRSYHGKTEHSSYAIDVSWHICSQCVTLIEKEIGTQFKRY